MPAKIIGTCSLCQGPVAIIEPWMGTHSGTPTCQNCGARKKDPYGPVIEMVPYKGLPGTIQPTTIDWKLGNPTCSPFSNCVVQHINSDDSVAFTKAVQEALDQHDTKNNPT